MPHVSSCPSCSAENAVGSRFCSSCGQAIGTASQMATALPGPGSPVAVAVGRLISSGAIPVGGFTPGTILADRYRIIGLLGRGGMGEVYRADDVKLGQTVALKFLPASLSADPVRRERFFAEVRITRQLAHPNICRVYDIGEVDSQHFLSMEYIDGEDLASLLKRIGYLPNEKALDITRQLLAGLGAAHDRGVLHRDLKPANIMIDGRGRVRITDFGLAIAMADESQSVGDVSGTPAYMAPEQLAGRGASVRSDIYALGLVVYEITTGKEAFSARTIAELREQKERHTPTAPSDVRSGIDAALERVIVRCLERDPRARPSSIAQLAAALPGGDPLAAALAAGETPSPELVAASGEREGLRPAIAVGLLLVVIAGALASILMNDRAMLVRRVNFRKSPEALAERAREVLSRTGYANEPADSAFGLNAYSDFLDYLRRSDATSTRWNHLDDFDAISFWYRQSPRPLARAGRLFGGVGPEDPHLQFAGEVLVRFDGEGRLRTLDSMPPEIDPIDRTTVAANWASLFSDAGLDISQWTPVEPLRTPRFYADTRAAWTGTLPQGRQPQVRIEAASYRGKPVFFEIVGPWTRARRTDTATSSVGQKIGLWIAALIFGSVVLGAAVAARRNLRLGRGDRRGATRLALFAFGSEFVIWALAEHHVADAGEAVLVIRFLSVSLLHAGTGWVLYIALEPFLRRRWPHTLVSWTRLLSGSWRDERVGRDVLIGCAIGVVVACVNRIEFMAPGWFNQAPFLNVVAIDDARSPISSLLTALLLGGGQALAALFFLVLLRTILRNAWLAAAVWVLLLTVANTLQVGSPYVVPFEILGQSLMLFALMRFGFVGVMAASLVLGITESVPITYQASAWYSGLGYSALAVIVGIALYGFWASRGGQPLLGDAQID